MYSDKPVEFRIGNEIERPRMDARLRRLRWRIGRLLAHFVEPVLRANENQRLHNIQFARADRGGARMSDVQFLELQEYQEICMDIEGRRKYFRNSDHTRTMHGIAPPLIETLLRQDSSVRSVLDIGCNYAYMDHLMAQRFPQVRFFGIDAPRELEMFNEDIRQPNLQVRSGYALDLIERGEARADLCYFSSTAVTIRNPELRAYLAEMAKFAKYVVFSEPIYVSPDGVTENPDAVSPADSVPTFLQIHFGTNKRGYLNYAHNYRAIVEQSGFEVMHYRVFVPHFTDMHWVLLAAKNPNRDLWQSA